MEPRILTVDETKKLLTNHPIPPRPEILMRLMEEQRKNEPDLGAMASLIEGDVSIAASVLKTVNSPFFGLRREVASITRAVLMLGLSNVSNIVAAASVKQAMGGESTPFLDNFWEGSANVAMISAHLSKELTGIPADEAYTLGLFYDCGVPFMLNRFEGYQQTYEKALRENVSAIVTSENSSFRTDHSVVGYLVGRSWKLPGAICESVLYHHDVEIWQDPAGFHSNVVTITMLGVLKLAEHIANQYAGKADYFEWEQVEPHVLGHLHVGDEEVKRLTEDLCAMLDQSRRG